MSKILIKRGSQADVKKAVLVEGELAVALDTGNLFVGNVDGNTWLNPSGANTFAGALKATESSEVVTLHGDIGSDMHVTVAGATPFVPTADSPSPEKPIPIVGTGDKRNLIYIPDNIASKDGLTVAVKNGVVNISGTPTSATLIQYAKQNPINLPIGTYTISINQIISGNWIFELSNQAGDNIIRLDKANVTKTFTFTTTVVGAFYSLVFYANATNVGKETADAYNIMINEGSVPCAYVPYSEDLYNLPIYAGNANLLKNGAASVTKDGITFTVNADKSVGVVGTATKATILNLAPDAIWKVGTYTINTWSKSEVGLTAQSILPPLLTVTSSRGAAATIITRPGERINFFLNIPDGAVVNTTIYPTVNLGAVSLPYEPFVQYTTQMPLRAPLYQIGDVRDTVEACVKSEFDKCIVLDGTEEWLFRTEVGQQIPVGAVPVPGIVHASGCTLANYLASNTHFPLTSKSIWSRNSYFGEGKIAVFIDNIKSKADLTDYLAAHPLKVWYKSTAYNGNNGLYIQRETHHSGIFTFTDTVYNWEHWDVYNNGETIAVYIALRYLHINNYAQATNQMQVTHFKVGNAHGGPTECSTLSPAASPPYFAMRIKKDRLSPYGFVDSDKGTWSPTVNAWVAAQYAAGTPITILYQLAVPEMYASEPQPIPVTQNITTVHSLGPVTVNYNKNLTYAISEIVATQIALAAQK